MANNVMESEGCAASAAAAPEIKQVLASCCCPKEGPPKKREASQGHSSKANHSSRQHQSSSVLHDNETKEQCSETAALVAALESLHRRMLDKLQRFKDDAQEPHSHHLADPSSCSLDDQGIVQAVVSERNDEDSADEPKQQPRAYTTMHKDESLPLRSSSNTTNHFQWQIQLDHATTWKDYHSMVNILIEESFHNGKPHVDLPNSDEMIHFESCRQINKCRIHESLPSAASRVRVRRVQVTHDCREDASVETVSSSHGRKERQETFEEEEETEACLRGILAEIAMALEPARKAGPGSANGDEERNLDTTELEGIPVLPVAISDSGELVKEDLERRDDDFGLTIMQAPQEEEKEEVSSRVTAASVVSNVSFDDSTNSDWNDNDRMIEQSKSVAEPDQEEGLHLRKEECCGVKNVEKTEEEGGLLTSFDKNSRLPIHRASYNGDLEAVRSCLDQDDNIEATDKYGHAPLHCACIYGH